MNAANLVMKVGKKKLIGLSAYIDMVVKFTRIICIKNLVCTLQK